jgi:hypothetical protein
MALFLNGEPHPLGPPQPANRPISPTLGLEAIDNAPALAIARLPQEWTLSKEDVYQHVIREEDGLLFRLDNCFARKLYEAYLTAARIMTIVLSGQNPFVELGSVFSFVTDGFEDRAREIGSHPSSFDDPPFDYTVEATNPFDRDYYSELELIRLCHDTQRYTKRSVLFLNRAYNIKGQVTHHGDPQLNWDFHSAFSHTRGGKVNACYPGNAIYLTASAGRRLQGIITQVIEDRTHARSPSPVASESDTLADESLPGLLSLSSPTSPTPELSHSIPQPTPVNDLPSEVIQKDLERLNTEIDEVSPKSNKSQSRSLAKQPQTAVDPRLTYLKESENPIPVHARFIHSQYDPQVDNIPFQEECACKLRRSFQSAYVQGRMDEHHAIMQDNRQHGFVAIRTDDFADLASQLKGQLETVQGNDLVRGQYNAGRLVHHLDDDDSSHDSDFSMEEPF